MNVVRAKQKWMTERIKYNARQKNYEKADQSAAQDAPRIG